jgi:predicted alpha-1,6-mannanase (GH76 family)
VTVRALAAILITAAAPGCSSVSRGACASNAADEPALLATPDPGPAGDFRAYARAAAARLHGFHDDGSGLFTHASWWVSATAVTSLLDYEARTGDASYRSDVESAFAKHARGRFLNDFYDDAGWWALAWLGAFDITGDARYRAAAVVIFSEMQRAWDDTCGGGIWWNKAHAQKNAIANELFIAIAARLAKHAATAEEASAELAWATRTWAWLQASGLVGPSSIVRDGLDASCADDGHPPHTYTQGVLIGALLDLATASGDPTLVDRARSLADATLATFVDARGVLHERCEPSCGADNVRFKGIFMRNLGALADVAADPRYRAFLATNADWLWNAARDRRSGMGLVWSGPFDGSDPGRQASALDALTAAIPSTTAAPNLALGARATASGACRRGEEASAGADGRVDTKWCAPIVNGAATLDLDLGEQRRIGRIIIRHAGAGGEPRARDTRAFALAVGDDGARYRTIVSVTNNGLPVTIHRFVPTTARFVRLAITDAQCSGSDRAARIAELEVYER